MSYVEKATKNMQDVEMRLLGMVRMLDDIVREANFYKNSYVIYSLRDSTFFDGIQKSKNVIYEALSQVREEVMRWELINDPKAQISRLKELKDYVAKHEGEEYISTAIMHFLTPHLGGNRYQTKDEKAFRAELIETLDKKIKELENKQ